MRCVSVAVALLVTSTYGWGQSGLKDVLSAVESNNTYLQSMQDYTEARKTELQVGLNPKNPMINTNYVVAEPGTNTSELTIQATQQFNFPTVYSRKRELAGERSEVADLQYRQARQEVLLQAKRTYIRLVYHRQQLELLNSRGQLADSLRSAYQKRLEAGDASQIEVNKARIYALNIENLKADSRAEIKALEQKLKGLNGNRNITISGSTFPTVEQFMVDSLESEVTTMDPTLKTLEEQIDSYESQIALNKALKLPRFGAGYSYRNENGINFNGINFMVTLPLWQNKNLVESSRADLAFGRSALEDQKNTRLTTLRQQVEQYKIKKDQLEVYTETLSSIRTREILEKSLELGEIDIITFVIEEEYLFQTHRQYLKTQLDYQLIVANILKHRL